MYKIIINKQDDARTTMLLEDDKIVEIYEEKEENKNLEGNIYIGKVQKIVQGLQVAFIDIGEGKNAFIHAKDVLPKQDILKENEDRIGKDIKGLLKSRRSSVSTSKKRRGITKRG